MKSISSILCLLILVGCNADKPKETITNECDNWQIKVITKQDSKEKQLEKLEYNTRMQRVCNQ